MVVTETVGAQGVGNWLPVNDLQRPFNLGVGVTLSDGATLTYKVQHSYDSPRFQAKKPVEVSRVTTTATLLFPTITDHGLAVGDSVIVSGTGDSNLDGTFDVATVPTANSITYAVSNTGATAAKAGAKASIMRVMDSHVLTGNTTKADDNYTTPVTAVRLNVTAYTSGKATLTARQGLGGAH